MKTINFNKTYTYNGESVTPVGMDGERTVVVRSGSGYLPVDIDELEESSPEPREFQFIRHAPECSPTVFGPSISVGVAIRVREILPEQSATVSEKEMVQPLKYTGHVPCPACGKVGWMWGVCPCGFSRLPKTAPQQAAILEKSLAPDESTSKADPEESASRAALPEGWLGPVRGPLGKDRFNPDDAQYWNPSKSEWGKPWNPNTDEWFCLRAGSPIAAANGLATPDDPDLLKEPTLWDGEPYEENGVWWRNLGPEAVIQEGDQVNLSKDSWQNSDDLRGRTIFNITPQWPFFRARRRVSPDPVKEDLDQIRKDAARYRFLRSEESRDHNHHRQQAFTAGRVGWGTDMGGKSPMWSSKDLAGEDLDAAIDAHLQGKGVQP